MTNPDQNIPAGLTPREAKKAREWALHALNKPGASNTAEKAVARVVIGTVPEPRPTLADMTPEKREECRWMQADVEDVFGRWVITYPCDDDGDVGVVSDSGWPELFPAHRVTPRPDLPRMEWPGDEKPASALPDGWRLADHKDNGRVLVVRIDGENAIYATPYKATGIRTRICMTSDLEFADTPTGPDHLAVGTVIESADDPRIAALPDGSVLLDREGEATAKRNHSWRGAGYTPVPSQGVEFGPWAVVRIGQENE